ncbi:MAG: beta-galactosidase [Oscillospiraceae bacterium]|nr:beta-galactosidase [Oscillospiraceae bacterium]
MKKLNIGHITLGVCYYPEHWDKSLWRDDLKKMKEYGIETVRIAEFAWNKFEPHEGVFNFDFFDEFMEMTIEEDMDVIFCTPSATPPAWMSEKYPEILNADIDGNLINHGLRRHCNLNSEKYRFFVSRITEKIAEHYSKYKNIVAWQLDNEINCECDLYYSESDHRAFREYLKNKFGSLDNLNEAIGAAFWNQTYTSWDEVHLPRRTNSGRMGNPHIGLLEKRFISDTVIGFFKLQADIIRRYSGAPVTTNGLFRHIDYHRLVEEALDFITYDNYPNFAYERRLDISRQNGMRDRNSSYNLTRARSISPIFGIMEQQSGPSGWNFRMEQPAPKPGQIRLWTLQAIAHGADFVSYFRWRTCTFGNEIYWHGLHDYDSKPNRRTKELQKAYNDIQCLQSVCGNEYIAEAALLKDYDNEWDAEEDVWHSSVDDISYDSWFRAFQKKHIPYDLVYINDITELSELLKYKIVVYPHPTILTKERAALLKAYASEGGTVIFGCRTGYKDLTGKCRMTPMPGFAAELCGAEVEEFTFLSPYDKEQYVNIGEKRVSAPCFNDVLEITDGEQLGTFESNYYAGKTALSLKETGKGRVYYFGAAFSEDSAKALIELENLNSPGNLDKVIDMPESVELAIRGEYIFLLNYNEDSIDMDCSAEFKDMISGETYSGKIRIEGYNVVVLKRI